jgi:hypothetical protein
MSDESRFLLGKKESISDYSVEDIIRDYPPNKFDYSVWEAELPIDIFDINFGRSIL